MYFTLDSRFSQNFDETMLSVEKRQTLIDWFINVKKGHRDGSVGEGYASELADLIEP